MTKRLITLCLAVVCVAWIGAHEDETFWLGCLCGSVTCAFLIDVVRG